MKIKSVLQPLEMFYQKTTTIGVETARGVEIVFDPTKTPRDHTLADIKIRIRAGFKGPEDKKYKPANPDFTVEEWNRITQRVKEELDGMIEPTLDVKYE